jgi:TfdA family taurine catabolism dioxygenase TauD
MTSPAMPPGPIGGPSAWRGPDMAASKEWIYRLSAEDIAEIDGALAHVRRRRLDTIDVARADFPLPRLGAVLDDIHRELLEGRGFVLIRGVPVGRYSMADIATVYWGLGAYFGRALSQNAKGHVLGHVRDLGYDHRDPNVRIYQTTERQYFHTDSCDLVGLLCLRQARSGGLSAIISSVTVFNEMLARRPDLVPVLFAPFETDRRGEVPEGMRPWFAVPVFNWHAGRLSTVYVRRYIESARRFPEVPPLTPRQIEALDVFDSLLEDRSLNLFMDFEPGDIQLLHNHQILHDRTGYVDWPEPERKRHLLRLWLAPPDGRPLPECYAPRYGTVEIGRRGGILVAGTALTVPLEPV